MPSMRNRTSNAPRGLDVDRRAAVDASASQVHEPDDGRSTRWRSAARSTSARPRVGRLRSIGECAYLLGGADLR
jgi:hypothetical protein